MSTTGQQVWPLPEGVEPLWRSWDDEVVVYNVASQQTHLLDAFSAANNPPGSAPDQFNLTVISQQVSSTSFGQAGQGVGANSVMAVRLTN